MPRFLMVFLFVIIKGKQGNVNFSQLSVHIFRRKRVDKIFAIHYDKIR